MIRQFKFHHAQQEFVENLDKSETGDMTGNRIIVSGDGPEARFKIQIDDFANVAAAACRLIEKIVPGFRATASKEI